MPFTVPSYDAIRNAILRDIRNQLPDAAVGSDSDNFVRAAGVGAAIEGVYQHQAWLYRQIWPDTADPDELEHHAANRGLKLKPAVAAVGSVTLTGTKGLGSHQARPCATTPAAPAWSPPPASPWAMARPPLAWSPWSLARPPTACRARAP
ncbi:hypothetical protein P4113_24165 [Pseudomonas aeruginosa]|nr:hypothetical protein [Pseudomonas aeruginosa]